MIGIVFRNVVSRNVVFFPPGDLEFFGEFFSFL
jgi:hypothetical protein